MVTVTTNIKDGDVLKTDKTFDNTKSSRARNSLTGAARVEN